MAFKVSIADDSKIPHNRLDDNSDIKKHYKFCEKLGKGSFGSVYSVISLKSLSKFAMKIVHKEKAGTEKIKLLEREVGILKLVRHPQVIKLFEVYETHDNMYLVMELCNCELHSLLKENGYFSEDETRMIMHKLALAVSYLHKREVVHRDLKLENILIKSSTTDHLDIRVTDFGLSVVKGVGIENLLEDFCGTPIYMPPEIIAEKFYSQQCDVWSMGIIMFYLLSGKPPFYSEDLKKLYDLIRTASLDFSRIPQQVTPEAQTILRLMLDPDPATRITSSEILVHPWITGEEQQHEYTNVIDMMRSFRLEQIADNENGETVGSVQSEPPSVKKEVPVVKARGLKKKRKVTKKLHAST